MQKHITFLFLLLSFLGHASHNRSGEITYKRIQPYTKIVGGTIVQVYWYSITLVKYTDDDTQLITSSQTNQVQDRCVDTLHFGDNSFQVIERSNGGSPVCNGCQGCGCDNCGELIINENGYRVKKNIYIFTHQYPGPGNFLLHTSDPNRNADVINMQFSANQMFYLESLLIINSFSGPNNSPVFTVDPIDKACAGKCFSHNPGVFDAERDSLSFKMSTPRGHNGQTVDGYSDPGKEPGSIFKIDPRSGTLTWCSPQMIGEYNIAFIVEEWRKNTSDTFELVGKVLRDMQVVVRGCPSNDPPLIIVPQDTCVEAGTLVNKKITVSDPNGSNIVTLSGSGGAFSAASPIAVLVQTSGNNFQADFSWQTSCAHISRQYYQTTLKAEDNVISQKLATYSTYNVRVIPPRVQNVTASPLGSKMEISWTASACNPTNNPLVAYKIYRQDGCNPFVFNPCTTEISPSSGFTYIGKCGSDSTQLIDDNNNSGLVVGQYYSYMVVAVHLDGSQSMGSAQVCVKLKRDIPVVLNVDVLSTSAETGSIFVKWTRPLKTVGNLDTTAFPGPYQFILMHKSQGVFKPIFNSSANSIGQLDTAYLHTNINTTLDSNEYTVEFISGSLTVGSSQKATSVFLSAIPSDRRINLSWKSKTPWQNYAHVIFRKDPSSTTFTAIATTSTTSFSDTTNVVNKLSYCYLIKTEGHYSDSTIHKPLINKSQTLCVTAIDLTPPCTPTLEIEANCPKGFLTVKWKNVRTICSDDVINYTLYYKNTVDGVYEKVYEGDTTFYIYDGLTLISGCYAIKAQDESGNFSSISPDYCIDNCPEFELPNVFSPNRDGVNDFFKAVKVRQIKQIDLTVLDRWGNTVYKTTDPYFEWDGTNIKTKEAVSESTFFYVCTVFEPRVKGTIKRILKGTVQVVR